MIKVDKQAILRSIHVRVIQGKVGLLGDPVKEDEDSAYRCNKGKYYGVHRLFLLYGTQNLIHLHQLSHIVYRVLDGSCSLGSKRVLGGPPAIEPFQCVFSF
uniref:Uncharacterized protein n=1 Tax=Opuntia streptacantha TaxID=393608 RepID=A0A7C9D785_OPUST